MHFFLKHVQLVFNAHSGNHKSGPDRHDVLVPAAIIIQRPLTHFLWEQFSSPHRQTHTYRHTSGRRSPGQSQTKGHVAIDIFNIWDTDGICGLKKSTNLKCTE